MQPENILTRYLEDGPFDIVCEHSRHVAGLALKICDRLDLPATERTFVEEAALLHDIGVCQVFAPEIGLYGPNPYILHGVLGRTILEQEGLPAHGLVCERHTGVGLTVDDIVRQKLPLPHRDMTPVSLCEQIICFADLFYSKSPGKLGQRKSVATVRRKLTVFGMDKVAVFDEWLLRFGAVT